MAPLAGIHIIVTIIVVQYSGMLYSSGALPSSLTSYTYMNYGKEEVYLNPNLKLSLLAVPT